MRRRKRQAGLPEHPAQEFHHQPFRQLAAPGAAKRLRAGLPAAPPPPAVEHPAETNDDLFRREMAGVRPLAPAAGPRVAPPPPAPERRTISDPDAEALAELSDLVAGTGAFDMADSVECIEGAVVGLDRRLLRRLRSGDFASQGHLDLHGMTAREAHTAVVEFLDRAHARGYRCVLIIHGRGRNSKDHIPVLKQRLATWLSRGAPARLVLAFATARACDGGPGALYVLLRRQRQAKRPIRVTEGAKW